MQITTPEPTTMLETSRTTVLTPKGEAVRAVYALVRALRALDDDDRAAVIALHLAAELRPLIADLA